MASPHDPGGWDDLPLYQNVPVVNSLSFMHDLYPSWWINVLKSTQAIIHFNVEIYVCIRQGRLYVAWEDLAQICPFAIPAWTFLPSTAQYHVLKHTLQRQLNGVHGQVGVTVVLRAVWEKEFA